jgi:hypothetical protein
VLLDTRRKVPLFIVCGHECRRAVYAEQTRLRRKRSNRSCRTCGEPFAPKRADAWLALRHVGSGPTGSARQPSFPRHAALSRAQRPLPGRSAAAWRSASAGHHRGQSSGGRTMRAKNASTFAPTLGSISRFVRGLGPRFRLFAVTIAWPVAFGCA